MALVGYTNVGKSTLMNLLSKSDVFAENKLFATLDTTVRKVIIENLPFLLTDTVGFIRKLPTHLVDSFKSTLDEVREADLLLHVVDISHPNFEEQIEVVNRTLADVCGSADKPMIMVFNKVDAFTYTPKDADDLTPARRENLSLDDLKQSWMSRMGEDAVFISARKGINIDELKHKLYERAKQIHLTRFPTTTSCFRPTTIWPKRRKRRAEQTANESHRMTMHHPHGRSQQRKIQLTPERESDDSMLRGDCYPVSVRDTARITQRAHSSAPSRQASPPADPREHTSHPLAAKLHIDHQIHRAIVGELTGSVGTLDARIGVDMRVVDKESHAVGIHLHRIHIVIIRIDDTPVRDGTGSFMPLLYV